MFQLKGWAAVVRLLIFAICLVTLASCASPEAAPPVPAEAASAELRSVKLVLPPGSDYARFGHAVATDGETVVVGAWGQAAESGAAYVYRSTASGWERSAVLVANDATPGARLGYSLDVEGDTIAIGAIYDPAMGHSAGAVYLFERAGGEWRQTAKLLPEASDSYFGRAVSLEGDRLAVGAPGPGASAVHTFVRTPDGWQREGVIDSDSDEVRFGTALALDDGTLAVGAWTEQPDANGFVVVYQRSAGAWSEVQRIVSNGTGDRFGYSVDMADGLLAVGAPDAQDGPMLHLYQLSTAGWDESAPLVALDHSAELGHAVALYQHSVLAGDPAFAADADHAGQVLLAGLDAPGVLLPKGLPAGSSFGYSVAAAGQLIVVGAVGDGSSGIAAGAAYIFY